MGKKKESAFLSEFLVISFSDSAVVQVQRLQGRCEEQEKQLQALRQELKKASLGLEAFIITTQRFCQKVAKRMTQSTSHNYPVITCSVANTVAN